MSRRYDEFFNYIPDEVRYCYEDYYWDNNENIGYSRVPYGGRGYYVTTRGDVISNKDGKSRYMSTYQNQHGHKYVDLSLDGKKKKCLVHRLVAEAFIDNPNNYPIVRHLDDDPDNNYYRNLEWGTSKDNSMDMVRNNHDTHIPVYCYETDTIYRSGVEAAESLGISKASVTHCCKGLVNCAKGYHICYAYEAERLRNDPNWYASKNNGNFKPLIAISPDNERYFFNSRKEASEYTGLSDPTVSLAIHGSNIDTKGWKFMEA